MAQLVLEEAVHSGLAALSRSMSRVLVRVAD